MMIRTTLAMLISATLLVGTPAIGSGTSTENAVAKRALHTIAEIQGNPATQGPNGASPFVGQTHTADGIVTALLSNGFYMQMPDPGDGDPDTSDGIFVYTGGAPTVSIGDDVSVTGQIQEYYGMTEFGSNPNVVVNATGALIPSPRPIDPDYPSAHGSLTQLEAVEGMLVSLTDGKVVVPGDDYFGDHFYACHVDLPRPLREKGIDYPGLTDLPVFDKNPELIRVDMGELVPPGSYTLPSSGSLVSAVGPVTYSYDEFRLQADATLSFSSPFDAQAVRDRQPGEFTVASFNTKYLDAGDATKIQKASQAIRLLMKAPDIVALQEVVNQAALNALRDRILADDPSITYSAYVAPDTDGFAQELGYLVRDTVTVNDLTDFGGDELYPNSAAGCAMEYLNNRAPYVLEATITPAGGVAFDLTLINVHMKSLSGIDDPAEGERTRMKRFMGAQYLADLIHGYQTSRGPDLKLIVLGDFNAYPFTDGYVDVAGIAAGNPDFDLLESNTTLAHPVDPMLQRMSDWLPADQLYSFMFAANGQALDYVLATPNFGCALSGYEMTRVNADFPDEVFASNPATPKSVSDHDAPVIFFQAVSDPLPTVSISDADLVEGDAGSQWLVFSVDLCQAHDQQVSVDWQTQPGEARAGLDFTAAGDTLEFPAFSTHQTVQVEILADTEAEGIERLFVALSNPVGCIIGDLEATGRIIDDDALPPLHVSVSNSLVRLEGNTALKAYPTGGSGEGTYAVGWTDASPTPQYSFAPDENPVILDLPISGFPRFHVTVQDAVGNTWNQLILVGDLPDELFTHWLETPAPANLDLDGDGTISVIDVMLWASSPQQTEYVYPCD